MGISDNTYIDLVREIYGSGELLRISPDERVNYWNCMVPEIKRAVNDYLRFEFEKRGFVRFNYDGVAVFICFKPLAILFQKDFLVEGIFFSPKKSYINNWFYLGDLDTILANIDFIFSDFQREFTYDGTVPVIHNNVFREVYLFLLEKTDGFRDFSFIKNGVFENGKAFIKCLN